MDPYDILAEYYPPGTLLAQILIDHSRRVAEKALKAAERVSLLHPDKAFIWEAALLHDIGIVRTRAGSIGCTGSQAYIRHGIIGRKMLESHGLTAHALVCERHVGTGITIADIERQQLLLPLRDMQPITIEEKLICYADKFFSKTDNEREHDLDEVLNDLARFGRDKVDCFLNWHHQFGA